MGSPLSADAVGRMLELYRGGDEAASEALCLEILEQQPEQADALLMRGVFDAKRGYFEAATGWFDRAIASRPGLAHAYINRGHAYDARGMYLQASESYAQAIALGLEHVHGYTRLASALERCGQPMRALAALDRALELDPIDLTALFERVDLLLGLDREAEAVASLVRARAIGADVAHIDYALAALGRAPLVQASPTDYVRDLFDGYADGFEAHLVAHLRYRVPELVAELLGRRPPPPQAAVVELGCGTGLCGPALRMFAGSLVGVDLSSRMLDHARARGCYTELHCSDLAEFARSRPGAFDLAVAADVMIYFGDLTAPLAAIAAAVRAGGRFVFSVESSADDPVVLNRTRRFGHSHDHVVQAAVGWVVESAEPVVLRRERGADVAGRLYALRRLDDRAASTGS